jgi:hypothetical protein
MIAEVVFMNVRIILRENLLNSDVTTISRGFGINLRRSLRNLVIILN